jgi:hypothetical protein
MRCILIPENRCRAERQGPRTRRPGVFGRCGVVSSKVCKFVEKGKEMCVFSLHKPSHNLKVKERRLHACSRNWISPRGV